MLTIEQFARWTEAGIFFVTREKDNAAYRVVEKYGLLDRLPASLRPGFAERKLAETPKAGDPAFARSPGSRHPP